MFGMLKSATFHLSTFDCFFMKKKMTLEGDFETQKQHKCWTGQKKQFVALKGKSQNKLSKLSNVDEKLWMEKSRISFFVKSGVES